MELTVTKQLKIPSDLGTSGLGAHIFGDGPSPPPIHSTPFCEHGNHDGDADGDSASSDEELLTAMASAVLEESPWKSAPSYPPLYLSTVSEYLPPLPKPKLPPGAQIADDDGKGSKDTSWASEAYENSLEMDHVFERFTKRVDYEGEQCIRYELNGTPLPFSSDEVFERLFPAPSTPVHPVTTAASTVVEMPKRTYVPETIARCPSCRSKRVFECQLMPNLINVLRRKGEADARKMTDEERRKEVERALKGGGADVEPMDWGTCLVFSCEKDCCVDENGAGARECWMEEIVLIQRAI